MAVAAIASLLPPNRPDIADRVHFPTALAAIDIDRFTPRNCILGSRFATFSVALIRGRPRRSCIARPMRTAGVFLYFGESFNLSPCLDSFKESTKMPMLHFHCPKTAKPVATGVHMPDLRQSLDLIRGHETAIDCPYCGDQHAWQSDSAYFLEDDKERAGRFEPPCIDVPLK